MNRDNLIVAIDEAKRFLLRAESMEAESSVNKYAFQGCRVSGEVRRSSMDLSNALSDLRNR